nr:GNAT family N-acetyltransferase [Actinopolyspora halophila]
MIPGTETSINAKRFRVACRLTMAPQSRCRSSHRTGKLVDMLTLRALTADDWPRWREVRLAALADAPYAFKSRFSDWQDEGEARWRARFEIPDSYNVVALMSNRPVGLASGFPRDDGDGELRSAWVGPEARGHGVGDRLVVAVQEWAVRSARAALKLAVISGNGPAVALYQHHGFISTEELGSLLPDGVTREQVMVKALD